ncbi:MAG TPA: DUF167 domain-containing protein [bacterium]|jgi:uncharacterized protein (TIGR00251 family)|nr:DUF167 domain-containing protein [bacterium]
MNLKNMDLENYKKKLKQSGQVYLLCKVFPKASETKIKNIITSNIDGQETEIINLSISAPADKNKANQALIKLLATEFQVLKDNIIIISGQTDRLKLIKINQN